VGYKLHRCVRLLESPFAPRFWTHGISFRLFIHRGSGLIYGLMTRIAWQFFVQSLVITHSLLITDNTYPLEYPYSRYGATATVAAEPARTWLALLHLP
jgi:hypothetical protein